MRREPHLVSPVAVRVTWVDSTMLGEGGWIPADEALDALGEGALRHECVGLLVGESAHAIALAIGRNAAPDPVNNSTRFGGVVAIPRRAIVGKIERL